MNTTNPATKLQKLWFNSGNNINKLRELQSTQH